MSRAVPIQEANSQTLIVLAIHGTFAPEAQWAQPGSNLHRLVEKDLGSTPINWIPFSWSGGNSHSARELAAAELAEKVEELSIRNFTAKIHLIGHSHGGNVALMMLSANIDIRSKVASVTCLSTPFLKFKIGGLEQHQDEMGMISIKQISFGLAMTVLFTSMTELGNAAESILIISYILISMCVYLFSMTLGSYLVNIDLKRVQRFYNYQRIKISVLAVRVLRDEAILWISTLHLLATIPRQLRHLTLGMSFILFLGLFFWPILLILSAFFPAIRYWLLLGILMLGWLPVLMVFLSNISAFIRTGPWALGEDVPFGYFSKIQIEPWPSRIRTCRKVVLTVPFLSKTSHSAAYELPTCASEVARFLAAQKT